MPTLDNPAHNLTPAANQADWLGSLQELYKPGTRTTNSLTGQESGISDFVNHNKETMLAAGVTLAATAATLLLTHRFNSAAPGSEIASFVRKNAALFSHDEVKVLSSINWQAEARLPSVIAHRDPAREQMIIGKLSDIERHTLKPDQFVLSWPHQYTALSKGENLSALAQWIRRGGQIRDISPARTDPGFLHGERAFIASSKRLSPGQYWHEPSGTHIPPLE